jgi:MoaA/NifB/PqqE/SkfB family radical SAM enzyme
MLILLFKLFVYRLYHLLGIPGILPVSYTFSVTNRCNSKCKTCFIYNKNDEQLTVDEYDKLFAGLGHSPYWVTISGGEPFLRKDLPTIISLLVKNCRPKVVNIPSNGILTYKIIHAVKKICEESPKTKFIINLSVDGIEDLHDQIRRVPGGYQKVIQTYKALSKLSYDNLTVGIHTVISNYNIDKFPYIADTLLKMKPDSYITEIAEERKEMANFGKNITPDPLLYRAAIDFLLHRIKNSQFSGWNRITQAFRIEYYSLVKRLLRENKQIIPCYAGIASCQIAPNGDVWFCCMKAKAAGNIKSSNFKFRSVWFSKSAKQMRKEIRKQKCYCPLANASYTNMLLHCRTMFRILYRSFVNWQV